MLPHLSERYAVTTTTSQDSTPDAVYGELIKHTAKCEACLKGCPCREEAELRSASRAAFRASHRQALRWCVDCSVGEDVAVLVDRFFPGLSGPGGPAIPLCDWCTTKRAQETQREIEAFAERLGWPRQGAGR